MMSAEPAPEWLAPWPTGDDIRSCNRLVGGSIRDCGCCRPNLGGWGECPPLARGVLPADLVAACRDLAAAYGNQAAPPAAAADVVAHAQAQGFTGDCCDLCGNFRVIRNGTCLLCLDCAATSGCS